MTTLNESDVEQVAMEWLDNLGWETAYGPDIAPGTPGAERNNYAQVVLEQRLRDALDRLNPDLDDEALDTVLRRITNPDGPTLEARNRSFHLNLIDGVTVDKRFPDGTISGVPVRIVDFENPLENDWLAVNQFSAQETQTLRRPDIVLFVNGLPLGNIELKNPADENTDIWEALQQLENYQVDLPTMFSMNEVQIISDGLLARIGPLNAGQEWFKPWRTMESEESGKAPAPELQVMLEGTCAPERFLTLIRDFIVFDNDGSGKLIKKMAGYHQVHAVHAAVEQTLRATALQREAAQPEQTTGARAGGAPGDRRIGVVWHNQGAGKSLTMAFFTGVIVQEPAMENPTVVVLTDRNDLDGQLFGTFSRCQDPLKANADPGGEQDRPAAKIVGQHRRCGFHHHSEILPRGAGRYPPPPIRPEEHRRHRRRGPPQPVRLHRRFRAPHARRPAQRVIPGIHRDSHRDGGR